MPESPQTEPRRLAYRVTSAAEVLDCSGSLLYRLVRQGKIRTIHIAGDMRITHAELMRFLAEREAENARAEGRADAQGTT